MANNIKIKICGQNNPAIINHCLDLNISYQGLIFYKKSPRFIDKEDGGFSFSWKKGEYEAFNVSAVNPKTIYKADEVEVNFPCCSKNQKFNTNMFKSQWGIRKLYCEDCDKYIKKFTRKMYNSHNKINKNTNLPPHTFIWRHWRTCSNNVNANNNNARRDGQHGAGVSDGQHGAGV